MFGINPSEFIVLLVVAAVVLGPERLPEYAQQLARLVRELRRMAQGASKQVRNEMGPEFDDIDWSKLDPRQYDPRRIVREALADVWDPDDPLGLKEGNRPRQPGDDDDEVDGPGPGGSGYESEKPQSGGGPATADRSANGTVNLTKTSDVNLTKASDNPVVTEQESPVPPSPAFDPDAT
ncbi:MAG TPA: twin-arginine translocase TatA/TatE family subunit [Kineosporiaceae bacterium]|nr:twin-arginine translocase TatA/TatE family subunit [Kineosporiaceae bacterium]